jgi:hypothetical protein
MPISIYSLRPKLLECFDWNTNIKVSMTRVPDQTKSSLNPGSEAISRKQGAFFGVVLLCSMGWGSTNVFQPKNIG